MATTKREPIYPFGKENLPDLNVGDFVRIYDRRQRTDGLVEVQEFYARITKANKPYTYEYKRVTANIRSENMLFGESKGEGGFAAYIPWDRHPGHFPATAEEVAKAQAQLEVQR